MTDHRTTGTYWLGSSFTTAAVIFLATGYRGLMMPLDGISPVTIGWVCLILGILLVSLAKALCDTDVI